MLIIISLTSLSCSDSINPIIGGKEKIVFNCVIDIKDSVHFAYLTKSYSVDNPNLSSSTEGNSIKNALIRIWDGDNYAVFSDSVLDVNSNTENRMPKHFYYLKNYKINPQYQLITEAILPDGERIYVKTQPPQEITLRFIKFDKIIIDDSILLTVAWERNNLTDIYLPRMSIIYQQITPTGIEEKTIFVPQNYISIDNKKIPIYPAISNQGLMNIEKAAIDEAMRSISEGDSKKNNYRIIGAFIEVLSFDQNLNDYLLATYKGSSAYTINLNEVNYSNITNGLGLFGSYTKYESFLPLTQTYIKSFGYQP